MHESWSAELTRALEHINQARSLGAANAYEKCVQLLNALEAILNDYSIRKNARSSETLEQSKRFAASMQEQHSKLSPQTDANEINDAIEVLEELIEEIFERPKNRLAAYGTLRPGHSNYKIVSDIKGQWLPGIIRGSVREVAGYPAYTWSEDGDKIPVDVLLSEQLIHEYPRVDEFEGANYKRTLVPVLMDDFYHVCNVYETSVSA